MMLRISRNQMEDFAREAREDFHDRAVAQAQERFPKHRRVLGQAQFEQAVRQAVDNAGAYGFSLERTILRYLDVVFMLGSGFACDSQYLWAQQVLLDPHVAHQTARANRLHERMVEYAHHAVRDFGDNGLNDSRFVAELPRICREPDTPYDDGFTECLAERLMATFPHKWAFLGQEVLRNHVAQAITATRELELDTQRGAIMVAFVMTILGAGFASDPLVPWAGPVLTSNVAPPAKADALYVELVKHLQKWLRAP